MKVPLFHIKGMEAKHITWLMASNPRRPFEILLRLRGPSRRFREMLLALSYTAALLGLFWFMNKVTESRGQVRHHWLRAQVI